MNDCTNQLDCEHETTDTDGMCVQCGALLPPREIIRRRLQDAATEIEENGLTTTALSTARTAHYMADDTAARIGFDQ